jgi:hypothetical protein
MMLAAMRTERRLGDMLPRKFWAIVVFVGLTGCREQVARPGEDCLESYPGWSECCKGLGRPDNGICCPLGTHTVSDVDHPDWKFCVPNEIPHQDAGVCPKDDAGAEADAGVDAP